MIKRLLKLQLYMLLASVIAGIFLGVTGYIWMGQEQAAIFVNGLTK